jgi:hypothetical protein
MPLHAAAFGTARATTASTTTSSSASRKSSNNNKKKKRSSGGRSRSRGKKGGAGEAMGEGEGDDDDDEAGMEWWEDDLEDEDVWYLVKWRGQPYSEVTWEQFGTLKHDAHGEGCVCWHVRVCYLMLLQFTRRDVFFFLAGWGGAQHSAGILTAVFPVLCVCDT